MSSIVKPFSPFLFRVMKSYNLKHVVSFEETNLVGNVYYANHIRWQGKCREMFLYDHARSVLADLEKGNLALVTLNCSCEYFEELKAFDEVIVKMYLQKMVQNKIDMRFEYYKITSGSEKLIAKGKQEVACMERKDGNYFATSIPKELQMALMEYSEITL